MPSLTPEEARVLGVVVRTGSIKAAVEELTLSRGKVDTAMANIRQKYGTAHNAAALVSAYHSGFRVALELKGSLGGKKNLRVLRLVAIGMRNEEIMRAESLSRSGVERLIAQSCSSIGAGSGPSGVLTAIYYGLATGVL